MNELSALPPLLGQINIRLKPSNDFSIMERVLEELWGLLMKRTDETGIRPFSSQFFGDCGVYKRGNIEARFLAKDILSYAKLEKDLREQGYPVEFSRTLSLR